MLTKRQNAQRKRIERLYYKRCSCITIPLLEIVTIFKVAEAAIAANPEITDEKLGDVIRAFVDTIKVGTTDGSTMTVDALPIDGATSFAVPRRS